VSKFTISQDILSFINRTAQIYSPSLPTSKAPNSPSPIFYDFFIKLLQK
jgi:hypothetical protein